MKLQRILLSALLFPAISLLLLTGCSSPTQYGAIKFHSTPPGAEVINLKDDTYIGTTPVLVTWQGKEENEKVTVQLRKTGYKEDIKSFWVKTIHPTKKDAEAKAVDVSTRLEKR